MPRIKTVETVENEPEETEGLQSGAMDPWVEDLLAQKRHVSQLQQRLENLREQAKEVRKALQMAEALLFDLIEDAGQKRFPFS